MCSTKELRLTFTVIYRFYLDVKHAVFLYLEGEIKDGINVHILLPPTVICNVMTKLSEDGKRSIEEIFFFSF